MCTDTTYIALKSAPNLASPKPFWTVKSQFYAEFGLWSRHSVAVFRPPRTRHLGVAFAPEIMAGCMTAHNGETLVSGGAAVPCSGLQVAGGSLALDSVFVFLVHCCEIGSGLSRFGLAVGLVGICPCTLRQLHHPQAPQTLPPKAVFDSEIAILRRCWSWNRHSLQFVRVQQPEPFITGCLCTCVRVRKSHTHGHI